MPRRTTYLAAALLTATQCAAFTAPITMGLKPPGARRRRWRRAGTAAAGLRYGKLAIADFCIKSDMLATTPFWLVSMHYVADCADVQSASPTGARQ